MTSPGTKPSLTQPEEKQQEVSVTLTESILTGCVCAAFGLNAHFMTIIPLALSGQEKHHPGLLV